MSHVMQYQPQWIREDFVDFIAEKVNPVWAWKKVKASIVDVQMLRADFYQIQLQPNHNFHAKAFRAGHSILVTLVIAGIRQQRSYSIVKITETGNIVIAVKRQGKVSNALTHLAVGSVVEISQVQGDFSLNSSQDSILLLASGSGITAIYSLLQQALTQKVSQIDLIYFTRDDAFHTELQQLSEQYSQFNYHHFNTLVPAPETLPPIAFKKFSKSIISGSRAAFLIVVIPLAFTAASIMFSVAPTDGKSN